MGLADILLKTVAPVQAKRAEMKVSDEARADKEKLANIAANSRITVANTAGEAKKGAAGITAKGTVDAADAAAHGRISAAIIAAQAATRGKLIDADARLKTSPNDPEAIKLKVAGQVAGPFMNQLINKETPNPAYAAAARYLVKSLDIPDETKQDLLATYGGSDTPDVNEDNFMEKLADDPAVRADPNLSAQLAQALQYKQAQKAQGQPPAGTPTAVPPAATSKVATPTITPTPAPKVTPHEGGSHKFTSKDEAMNYYQNNEVPSGTALEYPGGRLRVP